MQAKKSIEPDSLTPVVFTPYKLKARETYMNELQQEHFRNILLQWKHSISHELDRTVNYLREETANFADIADRATQEEEMALALRARERDAKLLEKIDGTLTALQMGDYGYCALCGMEIGIRRLEARPTATLCVDCKNLQELKEKQLFT